MFDIMMKGAMHMQQENYRTECSHILSNLQTGKKCWFWFCTGQGEQALLLSELSKDPAMEQLRAKISLSTPVLGVQQYIGLLSVTKNGTVEFISKKSSLSMLFEISQWCARTIEAIPRLAVLKNSVMVEIQDEGTIVNRYFDPSLWKTLNTQAVLGTTAHAVQTLTELPKGQTGWFALAKDEEETRLVTLPVLQDPTGEKFATLLKSLSMNHSSTLKGTVFRGDKRFIFTCSKGSGNEQELFSNLLAQYEQETTLFQTVKLFRMKQTKKKEIPLHLRKTLPLTPTHAIDEKLLLSLQENVKMFFYFSDNGKGDSPLFVLSDDREDLKAQAKSHPKAKRSLRGSVSKNSKGIIVFQSSKSFEEFIPALIAWVQVQPQPIYYKPIFGARFIQKTSEGVLSKEKNDSLWSTIK